MNIKIYTDGACIGNPGPGGWAAILLNENEKKEIFGGEKLTTNNRMELLAVIIDLEDSVPSDQKVEARSNLLSYLDTKDFDKTIFKIKNRMEI